MDAATTPSLFDRTVDNLLGAWRTLLGGRDQLVLQPDIKDSDARLLREQMAECLAARGGEASARARAARLGHAYLELSGEGRRRFLEVLTQDFDVDREQIDDLGAQLARADAAERLNLERRLRAALVAPRVKLLTQFNSLPHGVKFLVDLRADLLAFVPEYPVLEPLEVELRELLTSWFDVGFLSLKTLDWDTSASLLEKLIDYEAVHAITSWGDLRNRLQSDRRCYGFFHPRMPDEPLIFIEVALTKGMADNVGVLLDEQAPRIEPEEADSAIFYSISNTQTGLAGIQFGSFLIKRVVDDLQHDFPRLKTFATLSPVPGFRRWLAGLEIDDWNLGKSERASFEELQVTAATLDDADWPQDEALSKALQQPLMRLCARYLAHESNGERALDPVAHFHLTNGARVERLNWLGDTSTKGLRQAAGLMVNYLYNLGDIEKNHESYRGSGERQMSGSIKSLAK